MQSTAPVPRTQSSSSSATGPSRGGRCWRHAVPPVRFQAAAQEGPADKAASTTASRVKQIVPDEAASSAGGEFSVPVRSERQLPHAGCLSLNPLLSCTAPAQQQRSATASYWELINNPEQELTVFGGRARSATDANVLRRKGAAPSHSERRGSGGAALLGFCRPGRSFPSSLRTAFQVI